MVGIGCARDIPMPPTYLCFRHDNVIYITKIFRSSKLLAKMKDSVSSLQIDALAS